MSFPTRLYPEPRGRYYDLYAPELGLPEGNEVLIGLIIAIIAIPIGYVILDAEKNNSSNESLFPGYLGLIFILGGLVCLLPLIAWVFSILSTVIAIGYVAVAIIGIIGIFALIFSKNK